MLEQLGLVKTPWRVECPKRPKKHRFLFWSYTSYLPHSIPKITVKPWAFGRYEISGRCETCLTPMRRFGLTRAEIIGAGLEPPDSPEEPSV